MIYSAALFVSTDVEQAMQIGTVKVVFSEEIYFSKKIPLRIHSEGGKSCWMWNGCCSCTEDVLVLKKILRICSEGGKILVAGCGTVLQLLYSTVHFWSDKNDFSLSGL